VSKVARPFYSVLRTSYTENHPQPSDVAFRTSRAEEVIGGLIDFFAVSRRAVSMDRLIKSSHEELRGEIYARVRESPGETTCFTSLTN
jgi:hypothetical protein